MGISLITAAASEPVSIDEALAHLRITSDTEDGLVAGYLFAAREYCEKVSRLVLMQKTFDYSIDFEWPMIKQENPTPFVVYTFWRTRIELPRTPIISVTSVQYIDGTGTPQTLDPSQYFVRADGVVSYIEPAFGVTWPIVQYQPAAITVRFVAGFGKALGDIPETIRQAILLLVAYWYDNRGSLQFGARARTGTVAGSVVPQQIPPGVDALLSLERSARILS